MKLAFIILTLVVFLAALSKTMLFGLIVWTSERGHRFRDDPGRMARLLPDILLMSYVLENWRTKDWIVSGIRLIPLLLVVYVWIAIAELGWIHEKEAPRNGSTGN